MSKTIDWERIEIDYRKGVMTLREMGSQHGLTEGAIRKRAKSDGWTRDLKAKINAKADELVRKAEYANSTQVRKSEKTDVELMAQSVANVRLSQKSNITKLTDILVRLFDEIEKADDVKTKISCAKSASDALRNLITLEADAWGFSSIPDEKPVQVDIDPLEGARRMAFILRKGAEAQAQTIH